MNHIVDFFKKYSHITGQAKQKQQIVLGAFADCGVTGLPSDAVVIKSSHVTVFCTHAYAAQLKNKERIILQKCAEQKVFLQRINTVIVA